MLYAFYAGFLYIHDRDSRGGIHLFDGLAFGAGQGGDRRLRTTEDSQIG
jgi:hypothetical protein